MQLVTSVAKSIEEKRSHLEKQVQVSCQRHQTNATEQRPSLGTFYASNTPTLLRLSWSRLDPNLSHPISTRAPRPIHLSSAANTRMTSHARERTARSTDAQYPSPTAPHLLFGTGCTRASRSRRLIHWQTGNGGKTCATSLTTKR